MIIKKKALPDLFNDVLEGNKRFDLRLGDFECSSGDTLILEEWDPEKKEFTGRTIEKKVVYVLKTKDCKFWSDEDVEKYGFQVISFE